MAQKKKKKLNFKLLPYTTVKSETKLTFKTLKDQSYKISRLRWEGCQSAKLRWDSDSTKA